MGEKKSWECRSVLSEPRLSAWAPVDRFLATQEMLDESRPVCTAVTGTVSQPPPVMIRARNKGAIRDIFWKSITLGGRVKQDSVKSGCGCSSRNVGVQHGRPSQLHQRALRKNEGYNSLRYIRADFDFRCGGCVGGSGIIGPAVSFVRLPIDSQIDPNAIAPGGKMFSLERSVRGNQRYRSRA